MTVSGVFHMIQILIISVATCTSSVFVHLEKYALRNQSFHVCVLHLFQSNEMITTFSSLFTSFHFVKIEKCT